MPPTARQHHQNRWVSKSPKRTNIAVNSQMNKATHPNALGGRTRNGIKTMNATSTGLVQLNMNRLGRVSRITRMPWQYLCWRTSRVTRYARKIFNFKTARLAYSGARDCYPIWVSFAGRTFVHYRRSGIGAQSQSSRFAKSSQHQRMSEQLPSTSIAWVSVATSWICDDVATIAEPKNRRIQPGYRAGAIWSIHRRSSPWY